MFTFFKRIFFRKVNLKQIEEQKYGSRGVGPGVCFPGKFSKI